MYDHDLHDTTNDLYLDDREDPFGEGEDDGYSFDDYDYDRDEERESEDLDAPLWKYFPAGSEERELHR